jgi:hypothetical protein
VAVAVVLVVGLVVLALVRDQVLEGEPVVGRDEVDRGEGPPPGALVEVRGPGDPRGELPLQPGVPAPELADDVAVAAVPLGPLPGERAHLVTPRPHVPRLGDELDAGEDGVLLDHLEERRQHVHVEELAGEGAGEVEPEAVHPHLGHPVPERVHDHLEDVRVAGVEGVAGPRVVHEVPEVVRVLLVVAEVVEPAEREGGPEPVPLAGVVVDDVDDHLEPGGVEGADHDLEVADGHDPLFGRVLRLRGEEPERVVPPVVRQAEVHEPLVVELRVDGEELDGGHAEPEEVLDDRRRGQPEVGPAEPLGDVRVELADPLDVGLVDHRVLPRDVRGRSSPHSNWSSTMAPSGAKAALSRGSKERSSSGCPIS